MDGPFTSSLLTGASAPGILLSLTAAELALRPFTVVRVRGKFAIRSDQLAATEDYSGALGYAVVSDQAVAIGVTAVPTSAADQSSDLWFVYELWFGSVQVATGAGFQDVMRERSYDSKAMRKVEDGMDLVVVLESSSLSSGLVFEHSSRLLIKLH